jgi:formiminoglutamase
MSVFSKFDSSCIEHVRSEGFKSLQIGSQISVWDADFFVQNKTPGLLLFSYCEEGEEDSTTVIRRALYTLYSNWPAIALADAGHFVGQAEDLPETMLEMRSLGFVPILITPYQSSTYYAYAAFCSAEETVNLLSVDEAPDLGEMTELIGEKNWLTHLISHTPNFLFNYSLLAYQQYLSNPEALKILENFHFDLIRLGDVREKIKLTEPFFRNAELVSFDLGAVRSSDTGILDNSNPNGLYAEEACRLMRYAGHGGKLKCIVLSGFSGMGINTISAALLAQLIWHLTDGYSSRIDDGQFGRDTDFLTYTIGATSEVEELVFFKSVRSGRWWMKVPSFAKLHGRSNRHHIVPCNYEDYEQALSGELPETWWRTHQKLT